MNISPFWNIDGIRIDLLEALVTHMRSGNRGHEYFNFGEFNNIQEPKCGTSGCLAGECPILWPNEWYFGTNGLPYFKDHDTTAYSLQSWFGLTLDQAYNLFYPNHQKFELGGGINLDPSASLEDVLINMESFITLVKTLKGS